MRERRKQCWILKLPTGEFVEYNEPMGYDVSVSSKWKMIELRPGEIVLSRERLREAFGAAFCAPENSHKEMDAILGIALERELFGETHVIESKADGKESKNT